jgi:hypothetical protein
VSNRDDPDDDDAPVAPEVRRFIEKVSRRPRRDRDAMEMLIQHAADLLSEPLPTLH